MDIKETIIEYQHALPYEAELCRIRRIMPHYHAQALELVFCLRGSVDLAAGHQRVEIKAGEIFSIDYRDIHYLCSRQDNLTLLFHLDLTRLHVPWESLQDVFFACESSHCYPYQRQAMEEIKDMVLALAYAQYSHSPHLRNQVASQKPADRIIDLLLKYFNWYNYHNQSEQMNEELYGRFYRVLSYCGKHYDQKISISQLAETEHINKNYFSQFISKTVFESFRNMVKYIRCYEAEQLLLKTDMPNGEIAYKCGFSDPKYFYRFFKDWWGCTPAEHRSRYMEYMQKDASLQSLGDLEASKFLKDYITDWHLKKSFGI